LIGLDVPAPCNAVALRFDCAIDGVGVDPLRPRLIWAAWTSDGWQPCELDRDGTGGLNRDGDVVVHVPPGHVASVIEERRGGGVRGRGTPTGARQRPYDRSPLIRGLTVATMGGTSAAAHLEVIDAEVVGQSNG